MMLLCWSIMLLCLSATSESTVMYTESGENITLTCSSEGCPQSIDGYVGMYLYHEFITQEEVLFYSNMGSSDKIMERRRYAGRIHANRSLVNHIITISKLTVDDSGVYTCVYKKSVKSEVRCNVYTVVVRGMLPCSKPGEVLWRTAEDSRPPLVLIVLASCATSTVVTLIFILLIIPRVKQWSRSRRGGQQVSNDNVYEVMTKNGPHPEAPPEQSPPSPYDLA